MLHKDYIFTSPKMIKHLFDARLMLENGQHVHGPVTTNNDSEFLFRNTGSDLDLYFAIQKDASFNWQLSYGPSYEMPAYLIKQLGNIIDYNLKGEDVIETFADGLLSKFIPSDGTINEINFDFLLAPDLNLKVFYIKVLNKDGQQIWQFQGSQLLLNHFY